MDIGISSFERLTGEHEFLAKAAAKLADILHPERPRGVRAIVLRDAFRDLLHDHLAHEDSEVYPRLIACSDPATSDVATQFAREFEPLATDWGRYLARWPVMIPEEEWPEFCQQSRIMIARLRTRIAEENEVLYPTALAASVISLRQQAA